MTSSGGQGGEAPQPAQVSRCEGLLSEKPDFPATLGVGKESLSISHRCCLGIKRPEGLPGGCCSGGRGKWRGKESRLLGASL